MATSNSTRPQPLPSSAIERAAPAFVLVPSPTIGSRGSDRTSRAIALGLALLAVAAFALSLAQPWWRFQLYAPQYPHGLTLVISLSGLSGDVREIDSLNHYIGMAHLSAAAPWEREHARQGVALLCAAVLALSWFTSRRYAWLPAVAGLLFPTGFVLDSFVWLHRFGHGLDPHAPLHIPPFTPQLFGNGAIGQFMTFALPERGFWIAVAGCGLLVLAAIVRWRTHGATRA
jgi:hypothetical protein